MVPCPMHASHGTRALPSKLISVYKEEKPSGHTTTITQHFASCLPSRKSSSALADMYVCTIGCRSAFTERQCEHNCCADQLSQIDNVKAQRLINLGRKMGNPQGLKEAVDWINAAKQRGAFRGPVYGPILLEVQVQDKQHAAFLEGNCPSKQTCFTAHQKICDVYL